MRSHDVTRDHMMSQEITLLADIKSNDLIGYSPLALVTWGIPWADVFAAIFRQRSLAFTFRSVREAVANWYRPSIVTDDFT